jgi:hypothetical protein
MLTTMGNGNADNFIKKKRTKYEAFVGVRIAKVTLEKLNRLADKHYLDKPEIIRHGIDRLVEELYEKYEGNAA